jgi:hypothetical protein
VTAEFVIGAYHQLLPGECRPAMSASVHAPYT